MGLFSIKEKNVTLSIGLKLAKLLRSQGFRVFMTRTSDRTVTIEQRIKSSNKINSADLFISIHANSSGRKSISGIETFCLNDSLFRFGPRGCGPASKKVIDSRRALQYRKGHRLARSLQKSVYHLARKSNPQATDRGVKFAVPRTLLGVDIPGALIEVGFLSNKKEASKLLQKKYRQQIAQGICFGIVSYFEQQKNTT